MVGRATRALPGVVDDADDTQEHRRAAIAASAKPGMLVVDFCGNAGRHKLVTSADILGGEYPEEVVQAAAARARAAGKPVSMTEALEAEQRAAEERREREAARRARLMAKAKFQMQAVSPFDVFGLRPAADRGWHEGRTLTEKQRGILLKQGIDPDRVTFAQGKQLLNEIFRRWDGRLCSFKQAKVLKKYGFDPAASRDEAKTIIDKLAANGWRRPAA
jgi:type I site-specific restriction endonuclease